MAMKSMAYGFLLVVIIANVRVVLSMSFTYLFHLMSCFTK